MFENIINDILIVIKHLYNGLNLLYIYIYILFTILRGNCTLLHCINSFEFTFFPFYI